MHCTPTPTHARTHTHTHTMVNAFPRCLLTRRFAHFPLFLSVSFPTAATRVTPRTGSSCRLSSRARRSAPPPPPTACSAPTLAAPARRPLLSSALSSVSASVVPAPCEHYTIRSQSGTRPRRSSSGGFGSLSREIKHLFTSTLLLYTVLCTSNVLESPSASACVYGTCARVAVGVYVRTYGRLAECGASQWIARSRIKLI